MLVASTNDGPEVTFPLHFALDLRDHARARRIEGARPAQQRKATSGRARG
jgi:hypothetical protein